MLSKLEPEERNFRALCGIPPCDLNFKSALQSASPDTIRRAIDDIAGQPQTKTKLKILEARLRKLEESK